MGGVSPTWSGTRPLTILSFISVHISVTTFRTPHQGSLEQSYLTSTTEFFDRRTFYVIATTSSCHVSNLIVVLKIQVLSVTKIVLVKRRVHTKSVDVRYIGILPKARALRQDHTDMSRPPSSARPSPHAHASCGVPASFACRPRPHSIPLVTPLASESCLVSSLLTSLHWSPRSTFWHSRLHARVPHADTCVRLRNDLRSHPATSLPSPVLT